MSRKMYINHVMMEKQLKKICVGVINERFDGVLVAVGYGALLEAHTRILK